MEDGLVLRQVSMGAAAIQGLNPCCNGRWSRTTIGDRILLCIMCLNPCCNGRWSRTRKTMKECGRNKVLILVVMEDGLVLDLIRPY